MCCCNNSKTTMQDEWTGRFFTSSIEEVYKVEAEARFVLVEQGDFYLNDFYEKLDLDIIPMGYRFGWRESDAFGVRFSAKIIHERQPIIVMEFTTPKDLSIV